MDTQGIFSALQKTARGLGNQMKRVEVISENIANAEAMPDDKGELYQRKVLVDGRTAASRPRSFRHEMQLKLNRSSDRHLGHLSPAEGQKVSSRSIDPQVQEIKGEKLVHDPNHPQADENGYVHMPNVNVVEEMVDLMAASRAYEANVSVLSAAKTMARRILEI